MDYSFMVGNHKIEITFSVKERAGYPAVGSIDNCYLVHNGNYRKIQPTKNIINEFYYNLKKDEEALQGMADELNDWFDYIQTVGLE